MGINYIDRIGKREYLNFNIALKRKKPVLDAGFLLNHTM
jgi:hypothetical protein